MGKPLVFPIQAAYCNDHTIFTTLAIEVSPFSRSISSGTYNFLRWAGAAVAPVLSGYLAQTVSPRLPFTVAAAILVGAGPSAAPRSGARWRPRRRSTKALPRTDARRGSPVPWTGRMAAAKWPST